MAVQATESGRDFPHPCLCLVTDPRACPPDELPDRVAAAVDGGVDIVQLRDKNLPGGQLMDLASILRRMIRGKAMLLVNERVDVAVAVQADGVQLGEAALPTGVARAILGDSAMVGRSVHSVSGATDAQQQGADFLLVGTMFATRSHPGEEPSGPGLLTRIGSAGVAIPKLGIGGITEDNVGQVLGAGAQGVAVITSILAADDPRIAAMRLKEAMHDASDQHVRAHQDAEPTAAPHLTGGPTSP